MAPMRHGRLWWVSVVVFGLLGPVAGIAAGRLAARVEKDKLSARCADYLADRASSLAREADAMASELVHLQSFFDESSELTRRGFKLFTSQVLALHPAIQAIEWAPRVPASLRETHERQAWAQGLSGYRIKVRDPLGGLGVAPAKQEYYPVFFAEPFEANQAALGFDLSSEGKRSAALAFAIGQGSLSLSDPIDLVQLAGESKGLLALLPLYRRDSDATGAGQDRLEGVVLLVIRASALFRQTELPRPAGTRSPMRFALVDEDVNGTPELIGTSSEWAFDDTAEGWVYERPLAVANQRWRLVGRPTSSFIAEQLTRGPLMLGLAVFLSWELVGGLVLVLLVRQRDVALRKQARIHEAALNDLAEGVVVADARGRFLVFNPATRSILGMGPIDVDVREWSSAFGCFCTDTETPFPPQQLPLVRALRGETSREDMFIRNPGVPDGVWISVSGSPLRNERGAVEGGTVVLRDISAQKKMTEELRRVSNAVEQTADMVFITDRKGVIEYVNPAFEATTGYSSREVVGETPRILKSGKTGPAYYADLWRTILAGEVFRSHVVNRRKDGEHYVAEQTITPMRDLNGRITHFVSVCKDMTDRIKRQAQEIEMQYASQIQRKLYPAEPPRLGGYDIAGAVFPAEATCGDYFDYVPLPHDGLGLVIGDVCGHGLGPALIMSATRSYLRSLSAVCSSLAQIFETMNEALYADLERNRFVSMVLIGLDVGSRRAAYVNAGNTPGYHLDRAGDVKATLESTGPPLGMFSGQTYQTIEVPALEPGDLLVLLTDGIPETEDSDGNYLGEESALSVVRAHRHETAGEIVRQLHRATRAFAGEAPQQDDVTVVVCKVDPAV